MLAGGERGEAKRRSTIQSGSIYPSLLAPWVHFQRLFAHLIREAHIFASFSERENTGLNLVEATRVFCIEPVVNHAFETQDRRHSPNRYNRTLP